VKERKGQVWYSDDDRIYTGSALDLHRDKCTRKPLNKQREEHTNTAAPGLETGSPTC